jgi:hypothetical protein
MTGDYTRLTFRPDLGYSGVRLQQGRVQVDADWNEAVDIGLHIDRVKTRDVVGPSGVPQESPGFALTVANPGGTDLLIGYGRAYVDGVLVENPAPTPTVFTPVAAAPGAYLVRSGPIPAMGRWLIGAPGADVAPARVTGRPPPDAADGGLTRVVLAPSPAGASVTMTIAPSLMAQPDFTGDPVPPAAGLYALYLDVFEREVTALDDPLLRETALGGPDTCLRTQVVWQLRADTSGDSCIDYPPGWSPTTAARARLAARGVPAIAADDPCLTPDPGGYRGIDNRLFRVEVHRGGDVAGGQVLVKWSRDNAIHRTRFTMNTGRIRVDSLGHDDATALDQNQWVELQDEAAWRAGRAGHMVRLGEVNGTEIAVAEIRDPTTNAVLTQAGGNPLVAALPASGLLRRWEGGVPVPVVADTPLALESGIEVTIGTGALSIGDFWTIPARALIADVEWPSDPATGTPMANPPQGIARHYMVIGIIRRAPEGVLSVVSDCRRIFPPLTELISFEMLGGDGQEAIPNLTPGQEATLVPLPAPLRVGVARGVTPVAGRLVRFTTADANPGRLDPVPGTPAERVLRNTPADVIIATDAAGVAEARFSIHGQRTDYTIEARLLDAAEPDQASPMHLPIRFFASAEVAAEVGFNPGNCLFQRATPGSESPAETVQDALDRLCPAIHFVPLGGDGQNAVPGETLPSPLRVGLLWGGQPLTGVTVQFSIVSGSATLPAAQSVTGADGTVEIQVTADANTMQDGGVIRVRATPTGLPQASWPTELLFTARFATGGIDPPRLRVIDVFGRPQAGPLRLPVGVTLPADTAARGFLVALDGEVSPVIDREWFSAEVWIDVPNAPTDFRVGGLAFRPDGQLFVGDGTDGGRRNMLRWDFTQPAQGWIRENLISHLRQAERRVATARFVLHGGAIFSETEPRRWLDGALLFTEDGTQFVRPGGVGVPGSDMVLPFRISI